MSVVVVVAGCQFWGPLLRLDRSMSYFGVPVSLSLSPTVVQHFLSLPVWQRSAAASGRKGKKMKKKGPTSYFRIGDPFGSLSDAHIVAVGAGIELTSGSLCPEERDEREKREKNI